MLNNVITAEAISVSDEESVDPLQDLAAQNMRKNPPFLHLSSSLTKDQWEFFIRNDRQKVLQNLLKPIGENQTFKKVQSSSNKNS